MIIFLYGPDGYRRTGKLRALVGEYRAKYPLLDFLSLDLEDEPDAWVRARDFLNQPSMFAEKKMLVVRGGGHVAEKGWVAALKDECSSKDTLILISDGGAPLKPLAFLLDLAEPSRAQGFAELGGRTLELFVRREAQARGLRFAPDALSLLLSSLEAFPDRSARAVNELDRFALALRAAGPGGPEAVAVSRAQAEALIEWLPTEEVFRVTRRLLAAPSRVRENLVRLERLLGREDGARVFNSLAYAAGGTAAEQLADYDVSVKSGRLTYGEALTDFVIGGAPRAR